MVFGLGSILGLGLSALGGVEDIFNYSSDRRRLKNQVEQVTSAQTANYLKSGVLLDGTPQEVIDSTRKIGKEQLKDLRRKAIGGGIGGLATNFLSGYKSGSTLNKLFGNFGSDDTGLFG